jgi:hypothetical protein
LSFKQLVGSAFPGDPGVLLLVEGAEAPVGLTNDARVVLRRVDEDCKRVGEAFRLRAKVEATHGPPKNAAWYAVPPTFLAQPGEHLEARQWGVLDRLRQLIAWRTAASLVALGSAVVALVLALQPTDQKAEALTKVASAQIDDNDQVALAWPRYDVPAPIKTLQQLGIREVPVRVPGSDATTPALLRVARRVPLQADVARLEPMRRLVTRASSASCKLRVRTRSFAMRVAMINGTAKPAAAIPECNRKVPAVQKPQVTSSVDTSTVVVPLLALISAALATVLLARELWPFQPSE